jgi:hypothetical protein
MPVEQFDQSLLIRAARFAEVTDRKLTMPAGPELRSAP